MIRQINIPDTLWALLLDKATQEKREADEMLEDHILVYLNGIKSEVDASLNTRLQNKLSTMNPEDKLALVQMLDATAEAKEPK